MPLRLLKPLPGTSPPTRATPQCEHAVNMAGQQQWREHMHQSGRRRYGEGRLDQCTRDAVVEIDGKPYCRLHGGQVVLDM